MFSICERNRSKRILHKTCRFHDLFDHKQVTSVFVCVQKLCRRANCHLSFYLNIRHRQFIGFSICSHRHRSIYFFLLSIRNGYFWSHVCTKKMIQNEKTAGFSMKIHKSELHFAIVKIPAHYLITSAETR